MYMNLNSADLKKNDTRYPINYAKILLAFKI